MNPKILLHYADGSLAQLGDRVEFEYHGGFASQPGYRGTGTLHSLSREGIVLIDISPETFQEDCGRAGPRLSHLFPIPSHYDWNLGRETLPDGSKVVHYTLLGRTHTDWSRDYPQSFQNFIRKL